MAIPLLILLAVGAGAALAASGCSKDDGTNGTGGPDTDTDVDTDTDTNTDTEDTNPCDDREGVNSCFYHCEHGGEDCSAIDIDINSSNLLKGMTDFPINKKFQGNIDADEPLGFETPFNANFGMGDTNSIGQIYNGSEVNPIQIHEIQDGIDLVPFSYEGEVESITYDLSGVAFMDGVESPEIQSIDPVTVGSMMTTHINGIQGGVVFEIPDGINAGTYFGVATNEVTTNNGRFLYYGYNDSTASLYQNDVHFPVYTSGKNAFAVEMLDDTTVLVANAEGGGQAWQIAGASLDIIDTTVADPADAVVATIPFGADVTLIPFPELQMTADKSHAIVAGGPGGNQMTIYIVDISTHSIVGSLDLSEEATEIGGIDVRGDQIAVSVNGSDHGEDADGAVLIIDFSDPTAPFIDTTVGGVGHGLGAIAMHESGTVYIAAKAADYETPPTDMENAPYKTIVAVDPAVAASD